MRFLFFFSVIFCRIKAEKELKIRCDSTKVSITAHVDELYSNLAKSRWDEVRLVVGSCNGTETHESGWITETFQLGACGGEMAQNGDISVGWRVCGARSLTRWGKLVIASKRVFNVKCVYSNIAKVNTEVDVVKNCNNVTTESIVVAETSSFDDLFSLALFKDSKKSTLANEINTGKDHILTFSQNPWCP